MKKFVLVLIVCTLLCVVLVACSPKESDGQESEYRKLELNRYGALYGEEPASPSDEFFLAQKPMPGAAPLYIFGIWYDAQYFTDYGVYCPQIVLRTNTGVERKFSASYRNQDDIYPYFWCVCEFVSSDCSAIIPDTWIYITMEQDGFESATYIDVEMQYFTYTVEQGSKAVTFASYRYDTLADVCTKIS